MAIQSFTHIFYPKFDCTHSFLHENLTLTFQQIFIHAFCTYTFLYTLFCTYTFLYTLFCIYTHFYTHFHFGHFFAHFPDTYIFKTLLQSQIIGRKIELVSEYLPSQVFNSWAPVWYSCHKGHVSGRIYVVNWREVWWFMIMIWILDYYKSGI